MSASKQRPARKASRGGETAREKTVREGLAARLGLPGIALAPVAAQVRELAKMNETLRDEILRLTEANRELAVKLEHGAGEYVTQGVALDHAEARLRAAQEDNDRLKRQAAVDLQQLREAAAAREAAETALARLQEEHLKAVRAMNARELTIQAKNGRIALLSGQIEENRSRCDRYMTAFGGLALRLGEIEMRRGLRRDARARDHGEAAPTQGRFPEDEA